MWLIVAEPAPTPVTVTVCGVDQLAVVKVRALDTVALAVALEVGVTTTEPPGRLLSAIV